MRLQNYSFEFFVRLRSWRLCKKAENSISAGSIFDAMLDKCAIPDFSATKTRPRMLVFRVCTTLTLKRLVCVCVCVGGGGGGGGCSAKRFDTN